MEKKREKNSKIFVVSAEEPRAYTLYICVPFVAIYIVVYVLPNVLIAVLVACMNLNFE